MKNNNTVNKLCAEMLNLIRIINPVAAERPVEVRLPEQASQ